MKIGKISQIFTALILIFVGFFFSSKNIFAVECCRNKDSGKVFKVEREALCYYVNGEILLLSDPLCVDAPLVSNFSRPTTDYRLQDVSTFQENALTDQESTTGEGFFLFSSTAGINSLVTHVLGVNSETAATMQARGIRVPSGAVETIASGISYIVGTPPANTAEYIADIGRDAGFIKTAYAEEGMGWNQLNSIMQLWKTFRNIAYIIFIIIFVVIGFMIMFRSKIGGQALLTIQSALPNIVVTLLLITFSYAIASLMVDLIYVSIYVLVGLFSTAGVIDGATGAQSAISSFMNQNVLGLGWNSIWGGEGMVASAAEAVGDIAGDIIKSTFIETISSTLATLIFGVALLIATFRVFFQILIAYIGIILQVIFAPILLLANAMPGSKAFANWIKNLFANVAIFPVVALMFILAAALTGSSDNEMGIKAIGGATGNSFQVPFLNSVSASSFGALIGFGVLMMMPKVIELVQKALKVESPMAGMMGAAMEPIKGGAKYAIQRPYQKFAEAGEEGKQMEMQQTLHQQTIPGFRGPKRHMIKKGLTNTLKFWK